MSDVISGSGIAPRYEPIVLSSESTVVAELTPEPAAVGGYQSEAQLEDEFIAQLVA